MLGVPLSNHTLDLKTKTEPTISRNTPTGKIEITDKTENDNTEDPS